MFTVSSLSGTRVLLVFGVISDLRLLTLQALHVRLKVRKQSQGGVCCCLQARSSRRAEGGATAVPGKRSPGVGVGLVVLFRQGGVKQGACP